MGNPALKPEHANNYDLLYERYLNPTGIIQAGFFYKQINDTLITTSYTATSGMYQGDLISQWRNVTNAEIHGFEGVLPAAALHAARPAEGLRDAGQLQLDRLADQEHSRPPRQPRATAPGSQFVEHQPHLRPRPSLRASRHVIQRRQHLSVPVSDLVRCEPSRPYRPHRRRVHSAALPTGRAGQRPAWPWVDGGGLWLEPHQRSLRLLHRQHRFRQPAGMVQADLRRRFPVQLES